jgi:hypothetical protein
MPLRIKGNNAIVTRETTPAQRWQGHLHINYGRDTIAMRETIAIEMMAGTPAHCRMLK